MSSRELKALDSNSCLQTKTRSGKKAMADTVRLEQEIQDLQAQLETSQRELKEKKQELERLQLEAEKAQTDTDWQASEIIRLQQQLENQELNAELTRFRALEELRLEHKRVLEKEVDMRATDQERMGTWIEDLKKSHEIEKDHLLQQIATLKKAAIGKHVTSPRRGRFVKFRENSFPERKDSSDSGGSVSDCDVIIPATGATQAPNALHEHSADNVSSGQSTGVNIPITQGILHPSTAASTPLMSAPCVSSTSAAGMVSSSGETAGVLYSSLNPFYSGTVSRPSGMVESHFNTGNSTTAAGTVSGLCEMAGVQESVSTTGTESGLGGVCEPSIATGTVSGLGGVQELTTAAATVSGPSASGTASGPSEVHKTTSERVSGSRGMCEYTLSTGSVPSPGILAGSTSRTSTGIESTDVVSSVTKLIEVQMEAMAAQARAAAVQHLPSLCCYTGEGKDALDDSFDRWIERFQERAKIAGWNMEHQIYQLKLHLEKTAADVFRMLPDSDKSDFNKAVNALRKRFQPADIEELRGLEFHHRMQGDETIEKLGISIQQLGLKAFPSMVGKEFDRLIKGRFYQALNVKWQRKLGKPKPEETFHELYDRARMLEQHEKQYSVSARVQLEKSGRNTKGTTARDHLSRSEKLPKEKTSSISKGNTSKESTSTYGNYRCHKCKQVGHIRPNCPLLSEATGRTRTQNESTVKTVKAGEDMTEEELETLLVERRLSREQQLLNDEEQSETRAVQASEGNTLAVGPTPKLDIFIEGVPFTAMVDTGAQSTIISRQVLHKIARHLRQQGHSVPTLEKPSVRLFGKDGQKGGHELVITAQLNLTFSVDGRSVNIPTFIQPESEQGCLLGMNVIPQLGIKLVRDNGEIILPAREADFDVAEVRLVSAVAIPSHHGKVLAATLTQAELSTKDLVFEPGDDMLQSFGVNIHEAVIAPDEDNLVWIPARNYQGVTVNLQAGISLGVARVLDPEQMIEAVEHEDTKDSNLESSQNATVMALPITSERVDEILTQLDLPVDELENAELEELKALVTEFADVFALNDQELGCTTLTKHSIDTGDKRPIRQQPYRTPVIRRKKITEMIDQMKDQGVVQPSCSPWASPIVLVPKKDGKLRFCVDYRRLNAATKKDVFPLPRVDDILDSLGGVKYFSSLDLLSGYWQIELDEEAKQKSAFITYDGLFEFVRMPFGLCNAPATFQRLMQQVLGDLLGKTSFAFIDDTLVASKTFKEHLQHLREVFLRLRDAGLRLKPRKCHLLRKKLNFLGHVISAEGVQPDSQKTEKVMNFPTPTDVTKVRQFLGLASYYRRFIANFARIAKPLHNLTKKGVTFHWSHECEEAFTQLKRLLCSAPVLVYPAFGPGKTFILETDASIEGLGAVLSQTQEDGSTHPIAYASRSLDKHEKNYGISELETLGLVWAVRYFRNYLLGHSCVVYTDHVACLSILNSNRPSGKLARWALTIQEMDLTIRHKSGKQNQNADALSRNPVNSTVGAVAVDELEEDESMLDMEELCSMQKKDPDLIPMLEYLTDGTLPSNDKIARRIILESQHYSLVDNVLHHENSGRMCVVVPKELRSSLIEEAHGGLFAGHFGVKKVYDRLKRYTWWRGMRADIRRHCRSCLACATRKGTRKTFKSPLQPIPVGGPFHRVAVDILQLPQTTNGNCYVAVFMDYFTKWPEAFAIADQRAETIAKLFVDHIVCQHGIPEELLSDRGTNFLSSLLLEVCKLLEVKKLNTSGYHPQTDGLVEKFNSTLINMIAKSSETYPCDWDTKLPHLLFAYRTCAQESTKESPFYLLYGRDPRIPTATLLNQKQSVYEIDIDDYKRELVLNLSQAWKLAQENIEHAQKQQKKYYDRKSRPAKLEVGDRVMVHMPAKAQGKNWKLARPFHGPYRILATTPSNVEVRLVDDPTATSLFVSWNRVRPCYPEQGNTTWTGPCRKRKRNSHKKKEPKMNVIQDNRSRMGPVTRSMARQEL